MPKCTDEVVGFGRVGRRVVEAAFDGADIVSDGGALLPKQVDERLGLTRAAARAFGDERRRASVQHGMHSLLAQRIYGRCLGWSDVCDHNVLRSDLVMQTAVGRAEPLASAPTLSRLETGATAEHAAALHGVLMQQFSASHARLRSIGASEATIGRSRAPDPPAQPSANTCSVIRCDAGERSGVPSIEHITLEDRDAVLAAVDAFEKGLDFADALQVARSSRASGFATFDRRLVKRAKGLGLVPPVELLA